MYKSDCIGEIKINTFVNYLNAENRNDQSIWSILCKLHKQKFFYFFEMSRVTYEDAMSELAVMFPGLTTELLDAVLRQNSIIPFRNYSGTT